MRKANKGMRPTKVYRSLSGFPEMRLTRATVLRKVAEGPRLFSREFNAALVQLLYFGYLPRDPREDELRHWLVELNITGGDFNLAGIVKALAESDEYHARFGWP